MRTKFAQPFLSNTVRVTSNHIASTIEAKQRIAKWESKRRRIILRWIGDWRGCDRTPGTDQKPNCNTA